MITSEKCSAVIVTYNPEIDVVMNLIDSINSQGCNVILVDNGSENINEIKKIIIESNFIKLIPLKNNVGLAKAQNIGILDAFKENDFFFIFDQDSYIPEDFFNKQIKCYKSLINKNSVACVGPKFVDRDTGYEYPATVYIGPFIKRVAVSNHPVEATFIIASGSLIPKAAIRKVGVMLEDFFIDFVDIEWCMRAKYHGMKSFINPDVIMKHTIGDSRIHIGKRMISLHSDFRKFYIYRNGLFMARLKYIPFWYKVRVLIFNFIRTIIGLLKSKNIKNTINYSVKGWRSGFCKFNKDGSLVSHNND